MDGDKEGDVDGETIGAFVGDEERTIDGNTLGFTDGFFDGTALGLFVHR